MCVGRGGVRPKGIIRGENNDVVDFNSAQKDSPPSLPRNWPGMPSIVVATFCAESLHEHFVDRSVALSVSGTAASVLSRSSDVPIGISKDDEPNTLGVCELSRQLMIRCAIVMARGSLE